MLKKKLLVLCSAVLSVGLLAAKTEQTVGKVDSEVLLSEATDYHVLSAEFGNGSVDLANTDAWLFLDSIRPRVFFENHASKVTVNGQALDIEESVIPYGDGYETKGYAVKNARVHVYRHGTVIIPHPAEYAAVALYAGENCEGEKLELVSAKRHRGLGDFDNKTRSFRLKRGYMATLAVNEDGTGFSRVYIADTADVVVDRLPDELLDKVSAVSVFNWQWPSKKGWCSSGSLAYNEIDLTESTWWYSWSADRPVLPNQEYVPIKQNGGWPSTESIENTQSVTHLLGANEPDRPEQANQTVEQALDGWETLMATGLRLGSPAIADQLNWLYSFIDECDARNYRVDFVAIHAYWGGPGGAQVVLGEDGKPDVKKWYDKLKGIHERTGRPLWITEWNNGANWTDGNETYWGSTLDEQWQQNAEIMDEILHMLDTCSFVERYSLYNWVGDRRRAVMEGEGTNGQYLTPTGKNYAGRCPTFAYRAENEVIHSFKAVKPSIEAACDRAAAIRVNMSDWNGEMTDAFVLERKIDTGEYEEILSGSVVPSVYMDSVVSTFSKFTKVSYRLNLDTYGETPAESSNTVEVGAVGGESVIRPVTASFQKTTTQFFYVQQPYDEIPVVVTGGVSNKNGKKVVPALSNLNKTFFNYQLNGWEYSGTPSLSTAENVSCLVAPSGTMQWGGLQAEAGKVSNLTQTWKQVAFARTFSEVPVVFADVTANTGDAPLVARVRNVTKDGFEIRLTCENSGRLKGNVNWLAIQQGSTTVSGKNVTVGTLPEVGQLSGKGQIDLAGYEDPVFLAAIQTSNDEGVYTVRYNRERGETVMDVYKDAAGRPANAESDVMGYVVAEGAISTFIPQVAEKDNELVVFPTVTDGQLHVSNLLPDEKIEIVSPNGAVVKSETLSDRILSVADLQQGIYLLRTSEGRIARFIKK